MRKYEERNTTHRIQGAGVPGRGPDQRAVEAVRVRLDLLEALSPPGAAAAVVRLIHGTGVVRLGKQASDLHTPMNGAPAPVLLGIIIIQRPRDIARGRVMSRVSRDDREPVAHAGAHVEPVDAAAEPAVADGQQAAVPLDGEEEAGPERRPVARRRPHHGRAQRRQARRLERVVQVEGPVAVRPARRDEGDALERRVGRQRRGQREGVAVGLQLARGRGCGCCAEGLQPGEGQATRDSVVMHCRLSRTAVLSLRSCFPAVKTHESPRWSSSQVVRR